MDTRNQTSTERDVNTQLGRRLPVVGLSIPAVMESTGLSRQTVYNEITSGRLRSFKVGKRRLVSPIALDEWVAARERDTQAAE